MNLKIVAILTAALTAGIAMVCVEPGERCEHCRTLLVPAEMYGELPDDRKFMECPRCNVLWSIPTR